MLLAACSLLISCQDWKANPAESTFEVPSGVENPENIEFFQTVSQTAGFGEIELVNGLLKFQDQAHVDRTLAYLEELDHDWIDEYQETDADYVLPDEALEAFEKQFGFRSLRAFIQEDEERFLQSGSEEWSSRLEATHFIRDDYLRTILSPDGEVIVGNSIFKLYSKEFIVEITDNNWGTLEEVRAHVPATNPLNATLPPSLYQGNVVFLLPDIRIPLPSYGGGATVENGCDELNLEHHYEIFPSGYTGDLTVNISDNVPLIPAVARNQVVPSHYDVIYTSLLGTGIVVEERNRPGYMGTNAITFPEAGGYHVCVVQHFKDATTEEYCGYSEDCVNVFTGVCCRERDGNGFAHGIWEDGGHRKFEAYFQKDKGLFGWYGNKFKMKLLHYEDKNGKWRQARANSLEAGVLTGTNNTTIFVETAEGGNCGLAGEIGFADKGCEGKTRSDKKRITVNCNPSNANRFFIKENSAGASFKVRGRSGGPENVTSVFLTQRCH